MPDLTATAEITVFDGGIWRTVSVPAEPAAKPRRRITRPGQPANRAGLSDGSPFAEDMSDTAYAPAAGPAGFAPRRDMSRFIPPATMRTHRPAVVWPDGKASDAAAGARWHEL
jgi:hypothetical protein